LSVVYQNLSAAPPRRNWEVVSQTWDASNPVKDKSFFYVDGADSTPLRLSPDGKFLALRDSGGSVVILDIPGSEIAMLPQLPGRKTAAAAFSADGRWITWGGADAQGHPWAALMKMADVSFTYFGF